MQKQMKNAVLSAVGVLALAAGASAPAAAYTVYVSNEKDNTITVLDSKTMEVTDTIKVGAVRAGITVSHDGKFVYLCASDDDTIEVIDTATKQIVGTLPSGPDPELFVLSPDGNFLYVANEDDNLVTIIDLKSQSVVNEVPVGVEPEGMGVCPDGKTIVNTSERRTWPTSSMARATRSPTTCWSTRARASPSTRMTARRCGSLRDRRHGERDRRQDPRDQEEDHLRDSGSRQGSDPARGRAHHKDGKKAFVALGPANRVAVINAETYEVEKYILVGQRVWQLASPRTRSSSSPPTACRTT